MGIVITFFVLGCQIGVLSFPLIKERKKEREKERNVNKSSPHVKHQGGRGEGGKYSPHVKYLSKLLYAKVPFAIALENHRLTISDTTI